MCKNTRRLNVIVTCQLCGKEYNPQRNGCEPKYCSHDCATAANTKRVKVECKYCGAEFEVKPSRLLRSKNICCSLNCSSNLRKINFCGENNHQFNLKGELNDSFKSDFKMSNYGYVLIRELNHPFTQYNGFMFFHRKLMEDWLLENEPHSEYLFNYEGRKYLRMDVVVHHINENKLDNRISNLEITTLPEHTKYHHTKKDNVGRYTEKEKNKPVKLERNVFNDAGQDLFSSESVVISSGDSKLISTNLSISIPKNHVGLVWSRSGLAVKHNIEVGAGCIDEGYRGEVKVLLRNFGKEDYVVEEGAKIAQLLTIPINLNNYERVDHLEETERGSNGFGSSGF